MENRTDTEECRDLVQSIAKTLSDRKKMKNYVSVNLTGKSRFELNVSRHELNKNREAIKKWIEKVGKNIQRKVAENCMQVFEENGLEDDQEDLLVAKGNDDFAKECYENMKYILSEVEG